MESDKIIRDETSQEIIAVLQMKNDSDLNQNWREKDDVYFCKIESKCLGLDRLDAWERKRGVKSTLALTCMGGCWRPVTNLEKFVE